MNVFDSVLNDAAGKFGLSQDKASSLLSGLLAFIDQDGGGVKGFLDRFRRFGLGHAVSSWLRGDPQAVDPQELEGALGHSTIRSLASNAGISIVTASSALAFMIPKLVQRLAPGGSIPTRIPNEMMSYMSSVPDVSTRPPERHYPEAVLHTNEPSRLLWPALGVFALALLGTWLWQNRSTQRAASRAAAEVGRAGTEVGRAAERAGSAVERELSEAVAGLRPGASTTEVVQSLNAGVINFTPGSSQISADSYDFLNRAAESLRSIPTNTVIEVSGHADSGADAASATQLAEQRADAVRDYLVRQGVAPGTLVARGYAPSVTGSQNRNVTFSVSR